MFKKKAKHPDVTKLYRVEFGHDSQPFINIVNVWKQAEGGYITDIVYNYNARIIGFDEVGKEWFTTPIEAVKYKMREIGRTIDEYAKDIRAIRNL